jgi:hypothetical protein
MRFGRREGESRFGVQLTTKTNGPWNVVLTYDLLAPARGRSTVLLPAALVKPYLNLTPQQVADIELLERTLEELRLLDARGRTAQAKCIVGRIARGEFHYPGKGVAVHRYGPVPVVVVDTDQTHELPDGTTVTLRLGLYVSGHRGRRLNCAPSAVHFLESLKLETALLLRRYFEDAGEMLHAIQHRANLELTLTWAKSVEVVLAESVGSKLAEILDEVSRKNRHTKLTELELSRTLRESRTAEILQATYGRTLILYLLNQLYELLGIRDRSGDYRRKLETFESRNESLYSHPLREVMALDATLADLVGIFSAYSTCIDSTFPVEMAPVRSEVSWVKHVAAFARFIAVLRKQAAPTTEERSKVFDPRFVKIFLSSNHSVPSAIEISRQLTNTLKDSAHWIQILRTQEPADVEFKELIQARIWISDAALAVLPRDPTRFEATVGNYRWIGKEIALALAMGKRVSFVQEVGADSQLIQADFTSIDNELFPWIGEPQGRNMLLGRYNEFTRGEFSINDPSRSLDERVRNQMVALERAVLLQRTESLVRGYLRQFPRSLLANLKYLRLAKTGVQASLMAGILKTADDAVPNPDEHAEEVPKKATGKFRYLFNAATSRAIVVGGDTYTIMGVLKGKRGKPSVYSWELTALLRALRPWSSDSEIQRWERELLDWVAARGADVSV